jgi:hypothetical protein
VSTEGTPRTWTLWRENYEWRVRADGDMPAIKSEPAVALIELVPVLDLLERHLPMDGKPRCAVDRETIALLQSHGRLKGASDE